MAAGAVVALLLLAPAAAHSAPTSFQRPGQMAISSDGAHLYVSDANNLVALRRDQATGELSLIDAYAGHGEQVELAPDGRHLYLVAKQSSPYLSGIRTFARNPATGALRYIGRWAQDAQGLADIEFRDDRVAYVTDQYRHALLVLDRDPSTGRIERRRELRNGVDGIDGLASPTGMHLAGSHLYVGGHSLNLFDLDEDGDPVQANPGCDCSAATDVELAPDGQRLVVGPIGPSLYDRDPASGQISERPYAPVTIDAGGHEIEDGPLAFSADGRHLYSIDWWNRRVLQFDHGSDGLTLRRTYYEGRDGEGLSRPRSLALSPDNEFVYLGSDEVGGARPGGGIAVFRRDPGSGELTFVSSFSPAGASGGAPRLLINDGAEYTNDPEVMLSFENMPAEAFTFEAANDGGFRQGERFGVDETNTYPWTLASTGPERLPKTVYVRLTAMEPYGRQPLTDDIVLDERPPQIVFARRAKKRLSLKARDALSGVSHMQATRNPKKPGRWVRYAKSAALPKGRGRVHVRVRDRARNRSKWKVVGP